MISKVPLGENISNLIQITNEGYYMMNANNSDLLFFDLKSKKLESLNLNKFLIQNDKQFFEKMIVKKDTAIFSMNNDDRIFFKNVKNPYSESEEIFIKYRPSKFETFDKKLFIKGEDSLYNAQFFTTEPTSASNEDCFPEVVENTRRGIIADDGFFTTSENALVFAKYHKNEFFIITEKAKEMQRVPSIVGKKATPRVHVSPKGVTTIMGEIHFKNLRGSIDGKNLYLQSGVKADNEDPFRFKFNSTIDVYSTENNDYLESFHIPSYGGIKLNSFKVRNDTLFAVHGNYLLKYQL